MLSNEHNELLTRTGTGTPMGELIRRYWVPALLSEEIPEPDCPPVRVRILSEELVAFRGLDLGCHLTHLHLTCLIPPAYHNDINLNNQRPPGAARPASRPADREAVMGAPGSAAAGRLDARAGRLKVPASQRDSAEDAAIGRDQCPGHDRR